MQVKVEVGLVHSTNHEFNHQGVTGTLIYDNVNHVSAHFYPTAALDYHKGFYTSTVKAINRFRKNSVMYVELTTLNSVYLFEELEDANIEAPYLSNIIDDEIRSTTPVYTFGVDYASADSSDSLSSSSYDSSSSSDYSSSDSCSSSSD